MVVYKAFGRFCRIICFLQTLVIVAAGCAPTAIAEQNYYNAEQAAAATSEEQSDFASKTVVVTSIQKCYDQLSREDALDIQKNHLKPYQECQRRLAAKLKKEQTGKKAEAKSGDSSVAGGVYHVQKGSASTQGKDREKDAGSAP